MKKYLGIDIGGTKVTFVTLNEKYRVLEENVISTVSLQGGTSKFLDNLIAKIQEKDLSKITKIGIAINAAVKNNSILASSVLKAKNLDLGQRLTKKLGKKFVIENDVVASTKAELYKGYGRRYKTFCVLNIGTGTHVNYVQNKNIVTGYNNVAGEISQMKIWVEELGKNILLDNLISGRGISNLYNLLTSKNKSAKEIFEDKGSSAKKSIEIFQNKLLLLFELIAYFYNPEAIILTGSIFKQANRLMPYIKLRFEKENYPFYHFKIHHTKLKYGNILGVLLVPP